MHIAETQLNKWHTHLSYENYIFWHHSKPRDDIMPYSVLLSYEIPYAEFIESSSAVQQPNVG